MERKLNFHLFMQIIRLLFIENNCKYSIYLFIFVIIFINYLLSELIEIDIDFDINSKMLFVSI